MQTLVLFIVIIFSVRIFPGDKEAHNILLKHQSEINNAALETGVSARLLASIIYAEHKLNYNLEDKILDGVLAQIGYNSSVGVAQIKVNTASWIKENIHNVNSPFYLGNKIMILVPDTKSREKTIEELSDPKLNILYAACYIAMIEKLWNVQFTDFSLGKIKEGIIATLYCLGIVRSDGSIRYPHMDAKMNNFGTTAQEFFGSFQLRSEFDQ